MPSPAPSNALNQGLARAVQDLGRAVTLDSPNRSHRTDLNSAEGTGIAAGDRLLTGRFEGPRATDVVFAEDIYRIVEAADPEALGRMETIISRFPEDWAEGTHQGETGLNRNKRMVRIKIDPPATYTDREGETHQFDEMHVTGILFTRDILANSTRHYDYKSSASDMAIAGFEAELARARRGQYAPEIAEEVRGTPGGHDRYIRELEMVLGSLRKDGKLPDAALAQSGVTSQKQIDFDAEGRPVFLRDPYPLLGGHGDVTAQRKFENGRYLLPKRGLAGPLVFGYGKFIGPEFQVDGSGLGVFVSLKRVNELPRLGEAMDKAVTVAVKSRSLANSLRTSDALTSPLSRLGTLGALGAINQMITAIRDPLSMYRGISTDTIRRGAEGYGRAIRMVLGDKDLKDPERCLIPYKYPHRGNVAVDVANPRPDGSYRTVWYDLGGWKLGNTMTQFQRFGFVFYSFGYGLTDVVDAATTEGGTFQGLAKVGTLDIVQEYLRGFFYDRLNHPEFSKWIGKPPIFYDCVPKAYQPPMTDTILGPLYLQSHVPFVSLVREMMGMSLDVLTITECVRRWIGAPEVSVPQKFKRGPATVAITAALYAHVGAYESGTICKAFQTQGLNFAVKGMGQRIANELNAAMGGGSVQQ